VFGLEKVGESPSPNIKAESGFSRTTALVLRIIGILSKNMVWSIVNDSCKIDRGIFLQEEPETESFNASQWRCMVGNPARRSRRIALIDVVCDVTSDKGIHTVGIPIPLRVECKWGPMESSPLHEESFLR
jgi:hypothetical protein